MAVPVRRGHRSTMERGQRASLFDACHRRDRRFNQLVRSARGFRVLGPVGQVGRVVGHRVGRTGTAEALVVRAGLFGRRTTEIPLDDVEWILPSGRRLVLGAHDEE